MGEMFFEIIYNIYKINLLEKNYFILLHADLDTIFDFKQNNI